MKKGHLLGEILLEAKAITEEQLSLALQIHKTSKKRLGEILLEKGFISEQKLAEILSREYRMPFVDLFHEKVDEVVLKLISPAILKKYRVMPLRIKEGHLVVATSDPLDISAVQEIGRLSGYPVKLVLATPHQIMAFINKYSGPMQHAIDAIKDIVTSRKYDASAEMAEASLKKLEIAAQEAPIIQLVNSIIAEAIEQNASDIHFEPLESSLLVRFRIDGILYDRMTVPRELQPQVISRVKIVSGMDIAERRRPQDGRISMSARGQDFDVRVSTLPAIFGEKVVLRLLNKESILVSLNNLGLEEDELKLLNDLIYKPYGIILLTGPTGAGKTTTMYSILNALNDSSRNIVTVEDPVEYELPRVNQTAINVRAGYTFATAIRHILRQDPDIIMVGEIRDTETVEVAIQAALTGHLVLSTLHTNDAPGAITRLLDMNIEPFLINAAVIGVIAQRLVRRPCPFCSIEHTLISEDLKRHVPDVISKTQEKITMLRPVGCDKCGQTGYSRRTGIFEILTMSEELKKLILKKADGTEISRIAISQGMRTLKASGIKKALNKITTLEEVMRVTFVDKG